MKLQYLAVICVLIIVPISMIMAVYIQNQIDAITLQSKYDQNLTRATYDAVKAFQLNTVNNKYSGISNSKIRDIEASVNTFYNSLITSMAEYVRTTTELEDYTPALLYTLYDGYYIYTTYDNVYTTTQIPGAGDDEERVVIDTENKDYENGLKPYIYYSAKYRLGNGEDIVVINYTLDNYITVYGNVNEDGSYTARSGYLIDPDKITNIDENNKTLTYDKNVNVSPEALIEHLITIDDEGNITEGDYYYVVYQNNKIYQEGKGGNARYFYYTNESRKSYVNAPEIVRVLTENRNNYGNGDHIMSTSAFDYYNEAYKFSRWVVDESKLDEITQNNLLKFEDSTSTINDDKTYLAENVDGKMFIPSETNNPMLSESAFNNHRLAVIRKSIETTLSVVIDNYEARNTLYDFAMPKLTDDDWYKILNNISLTSFLQGMSIGFRYYNNYAIVTNNINKEVIKPENIYIVTEQNGNREYHQPGCEDLLQGVEDGSMKIVGAYPTYGFQRQTVDINENNSVYYYPQNVSTPYLTGCYNCIVNATAEFDLQEIIDGIDLIKYYDKIENGGEGKISFGIQNYVDVRRSYMMALARERQDIYKSNINLRAEE